MIDGRFELLARLGGGGMGLVWRARDLVLHREVALKEVRPPDPALAEFDPDAARALRARVLREARALARIDHPHVVTIHHIVDGGEYTYPWLVMELVSGGSLQDRLDRDGPLTPEEAAEVGRGVLAGLRAAHAADIQHRDIKPANVLLRPDGRPVLTDFGIAAIQGSTALTIAGSLIGTPDYMAPERVGGDDGDSAADLWSLALMLYVAVEGHNPLRRANTLATLAAVLSEDVPPARRAGPLTAALNAVLVRDPAARPDAEALDGLLEAVGSKVGARVPNTPTSYPLAPPAPPPPSPASPGPPESSASPGPPESPRRQPAWRRQSWAYYAAAFAALTLGGVLLWTFYPDGDDGAKDNQAAGGGDAPTGSPAAPKITIGVKSDMPGFSVKAPGGGFTGFDVDVATYIAGELGHESKDIEWKAVSSGDRETLLKNGGVNFLVAAYAITEERKETVDFVGPYLVARQDVLMRVDDMTIARPSDLNGKRVCSVTGSTPSRTLEAKGAPDAVMVDQPRYSDCLIQLASRNVDAITTDDAILAGYAANTGKYRLGGFGLSEEQYGIGLPKGSALKPQVQKALDNMVDSGAWKKAMQKNLPLLQRETPQS
nr:serine/threonine-protein kinase [Streptomyces sp. CWNU-1]